MKNQYFRDRALELGMTDAYELINPSLRIGAPLNPDKPRGEVNGYKVGDLAVWEYIIKHQGN